MLQGSAPSELVNEGASAGATQLHRSAPSVLESEGAAARGATHGSAPSVLVSEGLPAGRLDGTWVCAQPLLAVELL